MRHPERLKGLVVVAGAGIPRQRVFFDRMRNDIRRRQFRFLRALAGADEARRDALEKRFGSPDYVHSKQIGMRDIFLKTIAEDQSPDLPRIGLRTELLYGEKDGETPVEIGARIAALIPNARLTVLPAYDHFLDSVSRPPCHRPQGKNPARGGFVMLEMLLRIPFWAALAALGFVRMRTLLAYFQQEEYDAARFPAAWREIRLYDVLASAALILALVLFALGLPLWLLLLVVAAALAGIAWREYRIKFKKPLVMTERATRLFQRALALAAITAIAVLALGATLLPLLVQFSLAIILLQLLPLALIAGNALLKPGEERRNQAFIDEAKARACRLYGRPHRRYRLVRQDQRQARARPASGSRRARFLLARLHQYRAWPDPAHPPAPAAGP